MQYVTIETVTASLGANWQGNGDANLSVQLANAWLNAKRLPQFEVMPDAIQTAGALVARAIASGKMYQGRDDGVVVSKSVKAGEVSVSKTYAGGQEGQAISSDEQMALVLIEPYLIKGIVTSLPVVRG